MAKRRTVTEDLCKERRETREKHVDEKFEDIKEDIAGMRKAVIQAIGLGFTAVTIALAVMEFIFR